MMTLERPGGPPPSWPGGQGRGDGQPDPGRAPLWPVIALALVLLAATIASALVVPHDPACRLAPSLTGKPHLIRSCP